MIRAREKEEGSMFQVDKKSVLRIVRTLAKEGKLHLINTIIKVADFEKQVHTSHRHEHIADIPSEPF